MDLDKMTLTELKALAYDIFAGIQDAQAKLRQVNDMIIKKVQDGCGKDNMETPPED